MSPETADAALNESLRSLVHGKGTLCGASVCYGNRDAHFVMSEGLRQEVLLTPDGFVDAPLPITSSTIYDLASLTKLYTLVSVLQLVERGIISLTDTLGRLDPHFIHLTDCTVVDCLTYQALLRTPQRVDAQRDAVSAREMVFQTRRLPLSGERLYSDMNALVMKYVVEAVTGLPFFDCLTQNVLRPAGLQETWDQVPPERADDLMNYNYEHHINHGVYAIENQALPGLPHDPKARLLIRDGDRLSGHAGLFATAQDVCRFAQALLKGRLISIETLLDIGVNRTGYLLPDGEYRQFLGLICFSKSPIQRLSEVPEWMGLRAFGLSGYTGNHLAIDPDAGVFDLLLGNRCHNRLSLVTPEDSAQDLGLAADGSGSARWPDGRQVRSSFRFIHQKDRRVHNPVYACLRARGWLG